MPIVRNMGPLIPMKTFAPGNNMWSQGMNENLIKMSMTIASSVKSRTQAIDAVGSPAEGDIYLDPATGFLVVWMVDVPQDLGGTLTGWFAATPRSGSLFYVQDEQIFIGFTDGNVWTELINFAEPYTPVARTLAFYVPGLPRANVDLFKYVSGFSLTLLADSEGHGAGLDVAPSEDITFSIRHGNTEVGTITFDDGSTTGSVNIGAPIIVNNALPAESKYTQSQVLTVKSPTNLHGAQGLNVTFSAEIWDRD